MDGVKLNLNFEISDKTVARILATSHGSGQKCCCCNNRSNNSLGNVNWETIAPFIKPLLTIFAKSSGSEWNLGDLFNDDGSINTHMFSTILISNLTRPSQTQEAKVEEAKTEEVVTPPSQTEVEPASAPVSDPTPSPESTPAPAPTPVPAPAASTPATSTPAPTTPNQYADLMSGFVDLMSRYSQNGNVGLSDAIEAVNLVSRAVPAVSAENHEQTLENVLRQTFGPFVYQAAPSTQSSTSQTPKPTPPFDG